MRTTIRLNDELLSEVKQLAARSGKTMTAIIEDALREMLSRRKADGPKERVRLIRHGEGGLRPGVNLYRMADLLDVMEPPDAPSRR